MRMIPLTGRRFGKLTVMERHPRKHKDIFWMCLCDCGNKKAIRSVCLLHHGTISCGCFRQEVTQKRSTTHGLSGTKIYYIWVAMIQRCYNPNCPDYIYYGARGIRVCKRWHTFQNFYDDMGERPGNRSLDRINNDRNYSPGNCRWATPSEQRNNQRRSKDLLRAIVEGQVKL